MAYGFAVLLRSGELREIEVVVENLSGVVEHSTFRLFDDFFECLSLETAARQQIVEVRHVGVEVLAVVEFYCCCADDGFECRSGVGGVLTSSNFRRRVAFAQVRLLRKVPKRYE